MIYDTLDNLERYIPLVPGLKTVAAVMDRGEIYDEQPGEYTTFDPDVSYTVSRYVTESGAGLYRIDEKDVRVHIVLEGSELISFTWPEARRAVIAKKESALYVSGDPLGVIKAETGRFVISFPGEPYRSNVAAGEQSGCRKAVFLLKD